MIYKLSWGIALILIGAGIMGVAIPYLSIATGLALIIAGISFIAGV